MSDKFRQASFQIHHDDNVCVALSDLEPGSVTVHGSPATSSIDITDPVKQGHKMASRPIREGEPVIKYGVAIGIAIRPIAAGEWVHLQNCKSSYDKRSSTLDVESGAPTDMQYL
ncbi:UxaA family hydrolase [Paenibacillus sp. NPDC056579]|uniref:UxaA family hydrolase n=1 Tax=unclassified Paenibacillus TaxID=185978 RepID=UPI001EF95BB1|nr:UxaA family hydrolase [Paenibacillus sp. H1-7]